MVEEQVAPEHVATKGQLYLPPDKGKALTELKQELADVLEQLALEVALERGLGCAEKVEQVRVLGRLLREVGLLRWERGVEVGDCLARPLAQLRLDLPGQDVAAPSLLDCLAGVPEPRIGRVELVQEVLVMAPGQMCSAALHNLGVTSHSW